MYNFIRYESFFYSVYITNLHIKCPKLKIYQLFIHIFNHKWFHNYVYLLNYYYYLYLNNKYTNICLFININRLNLLVFLYLLLLLIILL
jgi:hypothetical protein